MSDTSPSSAERNSEQIAFWNDTGGQKWVRYQQMLDRQLEAIGQAAIDAAALSEGESVLDVGCGCGSTTLALARLVGPSGRVTGIDISGPMLDVARRRAKDEGMANATFEQADAQVQPFTPEYDVLFSRFGVMFFDDPPAAFANLHRGMRSGGRVSFVCWQALHKNPWMSVPMMAAFQHVTMEPPASPEAPGPFAFADASRTANILTTGGFRDVAVCGLDIDLSVGGGTEIDDTVSFLLDLGPLGRLLATATPEVRSAVARDVKTSLVNYQTANGIVMPGAIWVVTANA